MESNSNTEIDLTNFELSANDYTRSQCMIGEGGFGKVFVVKNEKTNRRYAGKKIPMEKLKSNRIGQLLTRELKIMASLNHPNIVKFKNIIRTENNVYIIQELLNGTDLGKFMRTYNNYFGPLSEEIIQHWFRQIFAALMYLHECNIMHRDMKLENMVLHFNLEGDNDFEVSDNGNVLIKNFDYEKGKNIVQQVEMKHIKEMQGEGTLMVNNDEYKPIDLFYLYDLGELSFGHNNNPVSKDKIDKLLLNSVVKLIDFGLSKELDGTEITICGTPTYSAPEWFTRLAKLTPDSDLWSVGCCLYELAVGYRAFRAKNNSDKKEYNKEIREKVINGQYLIPIGLKVSLELLDLINRLLQQDKDIRIKWQEIERHPFIQSDCFTYVDSLKGTYLNDDEVYKNYYYFSSKRQYEFLKRNENVNYNVIQNRFAFGNYGRTDEFNKIVEEIEQFNQQVKEDPVEIIKPKEKNKPIDIILDKLSAAKNFAFSLFNKDKKNKK
jgi:serine/threonine protein kinase